MKKLSDPVFLIQNNSTLNLSKYVALSDFPKGIENLEQQTIEESPIRITEVARFSNDTQMEDFLCARIYAASPGVFPVDYLLGETHGEVIGLVVWAKAD